MIIDKMLSRVKKRPISAPIFFDWRQSRMKAIPRTGQMHETRVLVGPDNRISFADDQMPAILATPWLIAHLEYTAQI